MFCYRSESQKRLLHYITHINLPCIKVSTTQVNFWKKVIVRSDFCTAGWVGVESNSRWVVSLAYWNSPIHSVCFTIFGCFHAKSMSINFWHVPALQLFYSQARSPGWSCWAKPEAPVERWMSLRWTSVLHRAHSPLPKQQTGWCRNHVRKKGIVLIKAHRGALWQFPLFVSPHPTINLLKSSRLSEMSSC